MKYHHFITSEMDPSEDAEERRRLIDPTELHTCNELSSAELIEIGAIRAQEPPISNVEKKSLLEVLNAKSNGWRRPMLANGQLWEHYEPTSAEVIVFAIRCALNQRGYKWDNTVKSGSTVLDMGNFLDEFTNNKLCQTITYGNDLTPIPLGGACHSGAGSLPPVSPWQRCRAVLPRPCGPYNRFVYHAVASILYMYDDQYLLQVGIDAWGDENAAQQMLTEQYLTQFRERNLLPHMSWVKIMKAFGFIGALGYQCTRVKKLDMLDELAKLVARIFFAELINPWMAVNGGWVRFTSFSFFSHIQS